MLLQPLLAAILVGVLTPGCCFRHHFMANPAAMPLPQADHCLVLQRVAACNHVHLGAANRKTIEGLFDALLQHGRDQAENGVAGLAAMDQLAR